MLFPPQSPRLLNVNAFGKMRGKMRGYCEEWKVRSIFLYLNFKGLKINPAHKPLSNFFQYWY